MADSSRSLKAIRDPGCTLCPLHLKASTVCVPGSGSARLPVMILGEAPGREEDRRGIPFVGSSGKLLRSELLKAGLPLNQCYITNTVKCFPDGTPNEDETAICTKSYLKREMESFSPSYTLAVGGVSLRATTPYQKIGEVRGQLLDNWLGSGFVFPVWHPAYILRNRSKMAEWRVDLENFAAIVRVDLGLKI